ncbi:MAG: twin-arginine translocation signal domain-containing protein [Bauldia sp.]|nr:MAG: twin-arginine translocation signal domain-containing protein [Bauldia sp.]
MLSRRQFLAGAGGLAAGAGLWLHTGRGPSCGSALAAPAGTAAAGGCVSFPVHDRSSRSKESRIRSVATICVSVQ